MVLTSNMTECGCEEQELGEECFPSLTLNLIQVYRIVAILVGVFGNGFVIYASKQYSTFNLDSNTIFLVRHLGYADIGILVLGFLPASFAKILNGSEAMCTAQGCALNIFGLIALIITAGISVHRLLRCTFPQVVARLRRGIMLLLVLVIYVFAITATMITKFGVHLKYVYSAEYYSCMVNLSTDGESGSLKSTMAMIGMATMGIFFFVIVTINILLSYYSKKKLKSLSGSVQKQKRSRYRTLTTHSITALLILTWLPFATVFFINSLVERSVSCQWQPLSQFVINFYLLNFVGNPFLYCVTNINFMKFAVKLMRRRFRTVYVKVCKKINPDLDVSATNISTMDPTQFPFSSGMEERSQVIVERVYNNMLAVPDQKQSARRTDSSNSGVLAVPDILPHRSSVKIKKDKIKKDKKDSLKVKRDNLKTKSSKELAVPTCGKNKLKKRAKVANGKNHKTEKVEIVLDTRNGEDSENACQLEKTSDD